MIKLGGFLLAALSSLTLVGCSCSVDSRATASDRNRAENYERTEPTPSPEPEPMYVEEDAWQVETLDGKVKTVCLEVTAGDKCGVFATECDDGYDYMCLPSSKAKRITRKVPNPHYRAE